MTKQKKQKRIAWINNKVFDKNEIAFHLYEFPENDSIQVIIIPLADHEQRERDHEAQLKASLDFQCVSMNRVDCGAKSCDFYDKEIHTKGCKERRLKHLRSIKADKGKVKP